MTRPNVPLAWRQLATEPTKLAVSLVAVAAAVALVLVLAGLRRGMAEQVTLYLDHQSPVLVAQEGARNILSQTSILPEELGARLAAVAGVADVSAISQQYAMLRLHGQRVLSLLIGYDPGSGRGPWALASGREPRASGELVLDRVLASEHGLEMGSTLDYRGSELRIVGLSSGTSGFMTPLGFTTRDTLNGLNRQPGTANFFLVSPDDGTSPEELTRRINGAVLGVTALTRDVVSANDRALFVDPFSGPLFAMVAVAFAVAVLVVGLTIYSSTSERAREYATLKALGLRQQALLKLVATQATGLAIAGTTIGVLFAFGASRAISALTPKYLIAVSAGGVAMVGVGALAIAVVAALLPARYLGRLDPAAAFRR